MGLSIPPVKPYFPDEDIEQVKLDVEKILRSGMLTLGEYNKRFEEGFAREHGTKHAIAVNSGTSAIEISLRGLGIGPGDEVIVPTNTFSATAAAAFFVGATVRFADIDPETLALSRQTVEPVITPKTKAIMTVHIGGLVSPSTPELRSMAGDGGLFFIEDAAHAHGASCNGRKAGSFGDAGAFSFYPTKVMAASEGGMITTDRAEVKEKALVLRDQGKESFSSNLIVELGYNWRMNEISAAIGLLQLKRLGEMIEKRNRIARTFDGGLQKISGIRPQKIPAGCVSNYYKYTAFLDEGIDREKFKQKCREKGVKCGGEVYWPPLHLQPIYQKLMKTKEGDYPVAEEMGRRMVELPMYTQMTEEEAGYVVDVIEQVIGEVA